MNLIEDLERKALTFDDLKKMTGSKDVKYINYDDLKKYKTLKEVMTSPCVIILLQIESPNAPRVGHWILLLERNSEIEHFDSYGLDVDEELALTHEQSFLTELFKTTHTKIKTNHIRYQRFREQVNTCGRWCVARCLLNNLSLEQFKEFIFDVHDTHDVAVSLMTMLL